MLPTISKDRVPRGWSYPFGAEKISGFLSESKRPIDLFFYHGEYCSLSTCVDGTYTKLHGVNSYPSTHGYRKVLTLKWVSDNWGLSIFSVNSKDKNLIEYAFERSAISRMIEWLNMGRNDTWFEGVQRYQIGFSAEASSICFWEVHNAQVISAKFEAAELTE